MKLKIHFYLLTTLSCLALTSCSNKKEKNYTPQEITNNLLVNEQLPISILSNALEWPVDIIIGIDLGIVKLNNDGVEKLNDIYEEYKNKGNEDFSHDYQNNKQKKFDKIKWVKRIDTEISKTQLLKIKAQELKNNSIAQNNINNSITIHIDKEFNNLKDAEFGFFSIGFWKNLGQLSLMHLKSIPNKFSNLSISYLDSKFKNELENKWLLIIKKNFKTIDLKEQPKITLIKYNSLINLKHDYISKLYKVNNFEEINTFFDETINFRQMESDINLVISKLNLELLDIFGLMFFELFITLIILFAFNYLIRGLKGNLITTLIQTIFSPANFVAFSLKNTILGLLGNYNEFNKKKEQLEQRKKYANRFVGFLFILFSFIYFPIKHNQIENKIQTNIIIPLEKQENIEISIIDNLNTATEIFYTFI